MKTCPTSHVVVTGGEPTIYPEFLASLVGECRNLGYITTVETNGTSFLPACLPDLWSVSPKLLSSTPTGFGQQGEAALHTRNLKHDQLAIFSDLLRGWRSRGLACPPVQFKFVVSTDADVDEVLDLAEKQFIPPSSIQLMAEGKDAETQRSLALWLAETCKRLDVRMSTRLHSLIWGDRRGV